MAEACYTARATMQQVLNGINKLTLQTKDHGKYMHDAILLIQKGIQRVLISQFNPIDPGKGMVRLLDDGDNILMQVQSTNAIMAGSVLKSTKKWADELSAATDKTVLPTLTTQTEAQEEADQLNVINQSALSRPYQNWSTVTSPTPLYERPMAATTKASTTSRFTLHKVMKVAINRAERPSTNDMLEQLLEVINHTFDLRKKVSVNMELMQSNAVRMATYGIVIGICGAFIK